MRNSVELVHVLKQNSRVHPTFQLSQVTTTPAEVALRLGVDVSERPVTIVSAQIRGPFCEYASTLPAKITFRRNDREINDLKATVPDPCYWTPAMPHLYRVEIQYRCSESQAVETVRFERGLRRYEVRNNALFVDGERTVIRAVGWDDFVEEPYWKELRATRTSLVISELDSDFAIKCSQHGVPLFLKCPNSQIKEGQPSTQDFPAFFGAIASRDASHADHDAGGKYQARVTLSTQSNGSPTRANQLVFAVLEKESTSTADWAEKRKACDTLQAEVAIIGEFAGYVVL